MTLKMKCGILILYYFKRKSFMAEFREIQIEDKEWVDKILEKS